MNRKFRVSELRQQIHVLVLVLLFLCLCLVFNVTPVYAQATSDASFEFSSHRNHVNGSYGERENTFNSRGSYSYEWNPDAEVWVGTTTASRTASSHYQGRDCTEEENLTIEHTNEQRLYRSIETNTCSSGHNYLFEYPNNLTNMYDYPAEKSFHSNNFFPIGEHGGCESICSTACGLRGYNSFDALRECMEGCDTSRFSRSYQVTGQSSYNKILKLEQSCHLEGSRSSDGTPFLYTGEGLYLETVQIECLEGEVQDGCCDTNAMNPETHKCCPGSVDDGTDGFVVGIDESCPVCGDIDASLRVSVDNLCAFNEDQFMLLPDVAEDENDVQPVSGKVVLELPGAPADYVLPQACRIEVNVSGGSLIDIPNPVATCAGARECPFSFNVKGQVFTDEKTLVLTAALQGCCLPDLEDQAEILSGPNPRSIEYNVEEGFDNKMERENEFKPSEYGLTPIYDTSVTLTYNPISDSEIAETPENLDACLNTDEDSWELDFEVVRTRHSPNVDLVLVTQSGDLIQHKWILEGWPSGVLPGPGMEALVNALDLGYSVNLLAYWRGNDFDFPRKRREYSPPRKNCAWVWGPLEPEWQVTYHRTRSAELSIPELMSRAKLGYESGFHAIDPFKTHKRMFGQVVDLVNIDETGIELETADQFLDRTACSGTMSVFFSEQIFTSRPLSQGFALSGTPLIALKEPIHKEGLGHLLVHEAGHSFCGLKDEYLISNAGDTRYLDSLIGTNCFKVEDVSKFGQYGRAYPDCGIKELVRTAKRSIMDTSSEATNKFNDWSCGVCLQRMFGDQKKVLAYAEDARSHYDCESEEPSTRIGCSSPSDCGHESNGDPLCNDCVWDDIGGYYCEPSRIGEPCKSPNGLSSGYCLLSYPVTGKFRGACDIFSGW